MVPPAEMSRTANVHPFLARAKKSKRCDAEPEVKEEAGESSLATVPAKVQSGLIHFCSLSPGPPFGGGRSWLAKRVHIHPNVVCEPLFRSTWTPQLDFLPCVLCVPLADTHEGGFPSTFTLVCFWGENDVWISEVRTTFARFCTFVPFVSRGRFPRVPY
jgi:hypothetical protein